MYLYMREIYMIFCISSPDLMIWICVPIVPCGHEVENSLHEYSLITVIKMLHIIES